jgi:hypothetical protein
MKRPAKNQLLLAFTVAALLGHRCYADDFLGVWQTETNHWSAPGRTNKVEAVETIEFFSNHSFKITEVTVADGKRWTNVPYTGTYTILGTNRASLKLIPSDIPPGATPAPLTVACSIVGNELEIPKLIPSVVSEYKKYRRAK